MRRGTPPSKGTVAIDDGTRLTPWERADAMGECLSRGGGSWIEGVLGKD